MFDMTKEFTAEKGYHVVEIHGSDQAVHDAVIEGLRVKGYSVYGRSVRETSVQLTFVTEEFREVLKERHMYSCRNSLAGIDTKLFVALAETVKDLDSHLLTGESDVIKGIIAAPVPDVIEVNLQECGVRHRIMHSQATGILPPGIDWKKPHG